MLAEDIFHLLGVSIFPLFEGGLLCVDGLREDCVEVQKFNLTGLIVLYLREELLEEELVLAGLGKGETQFVVLLDDAVDAEVPEGGVRRH
jgi:hypothetical protein